MRAPQFLKRMPDIYLMLAVIALIIIGTNAIYNASWLYQAANNSDTLLFFRRYIMTIGIGAVLCFIAAVIDLDFVERYVPHLLIISLILLAVVLIPIPGFTIRLNGARRWINLGLFYFQPSEFAKLAFVLYLASILKKKGEKLGSFTVGFLPPFIVNVLIAFLIVLEPDLGTALVFLGVGFAMFFYAGVPVGYLIITALCAVPLLYLVITSNTHMIYRIVGWLNPQEGATGISFQLVQSLKSFTSGGLFGSSLEYLADHRITLPAASTDFILAVIAQRSGFVGSLFVVGAFTLFGYRGFHIVRQTQNEFHKNLAFGIVFLICLQALINMMVVIGLLPTTGLPLPFISYGRNALIVMLIFVGLLFNISRRNEA